jgi:vacuolar-type H+-ATPase subunit H
MKEAADRDREAALRTARREALELREKIRAQAEARYREILDAAGSGLAAERDRIVASGRAEAAKVAALGRANIDRAVDHVLQKFRSAFHV